MIINLLYDASVASPNGPPVAFQQDIQTVVDYISAHFTDNITIDLHVGFGEVGGISIPSGFLGANLLSAIHSYSFADYKSALISHQTTADDASAISSLPSSDPITGTHDLWLADSLAAALGLLPATSPIEGYVGFGNTVDFDYNRADGITSGQFDFIGTVAHEISEVLGRTMGVGQDIIGNDMVADYFPLDLFHYSSSGTRSFTRGGYFSIDGGQTELADFNPLATGDAGDWGGGTTNDSFLAFSNTGVVNEITPVDFRVMDILGYRFVADPQQSLNIISGTPSDDTLTGTPQDDLITGLEGNDTIFGLGGNDLIYGNQGNDLIYGNQGNDSIDSVAGEGAGNDTIFGGQGDDFVGNSGNTGADLIYGNLGNDTLNGGTGNDTLVGGQGNDLLLGQGGNNLIYGNLGDDAISGGTGNDTIFGGQGNDLIYGGSGNDIIYGNLGNDTITGEQGNDTIFGGQGNDRIVSDFGDDQDRMFGNLGADTFDFATWVQTPPNQVVDDAHSDRIADFVTGVDKIELYLSDFADSTPDYFELAAPGATTLAQAIAAASNASAINGNEVIFVAGATDGYLLINADGNAAIGGSPNEFAIVLEGKNSLASFSANDLSFV